MLWREFARRAEALDIEAIDALVLRDELESADLSAEEWAEVKRLDAEIEREARVKVQELERTGALHALRRVREEKWKPQWWWWLDRKVEAQPLPLIHVSRARPRATQRASGPVRYAELLPSLPSPDPSTT
jgi:hypothetical protein